MKIERQTIGSGVTARIREVRTPETTEELAALLSETAKPEPFSEHIAALEQQATEYLQKKGLPSSNGMWGKEDGRWQKVDLQSRPFIVPCYNFTSALLQVEDYVEDSFVGFAARLLILIARWRSAVQSGNFDRAMEFAHDIGVLTTTSNFKLRWEKAALTGRPVRAGSKIGGENRARKYSPRNAKISQEYLALLQARVPKAIFVIMDRYSLKKTAAWDAIRKGKELVRHPAKPD